MKTLHLTLKRKWFDQIASGEKIEEYREIKQYWINRLTFHEHHYFIKDFKTLIIEKRKDMQSRYSTGVLMNNYFDTVTFKNGYAKNAPTLVVEFKGIEVRGGNQEWGAEPGIKYFVIKLGKIL